MSHRLDPLLNPASIAVVGASTSAGVGSRLLKNLLHGGYKGNLYGINPKYDQVLDVPCFPDFQSLPEPVEHAIFAVSDQRLEGLVDAAIESGVRAMTILSMLVIDDDSTPVLKDRLEARLKEANVLLCGANGTGFFNIEKSVWANGFDTRPNHQSGGICLISQSGSGLAGIIDCDERINLNLGVSSGQELTTGAEDYLEYALHQPSTRVVGLFLETIRKPKVMIKAFELAIEKRIPIVILKTGKTARSAELTVSHSGGLSGEDDCYNALFNKYGIQRVNDMDEFATTLIMFAQPYELTNGRLVSIHDSGGERQLIIDLADQQGVEFAELSQDTVENLADILDPGLLAVNPLDAWGRGLGDSDQIMIDSIIAMLMDPDASMGAIAMDRGPISRIYPEYIDFMKQANEQSGKPIFLVSNRQGTGSDPLVAESTHAGMPIIDGVYSFLAGVRCMHNFRDFLSTKGTINEELPRSILEKYKQDLSERSYIGESEALKMFAELGINSNESHIVGDRDQLIDQSRSMQFPLVLKTALEEALHKSELDGVFLAINSEEQLLESYNKLQQKLPGDALLAPMIESDGVEMILGMTTDKQLGPMVTIGFGGYYAEALNDAVTLMPPFSNNKAKQAIESLKMKTLLEGYRGSDPVDIDAFAQMASKFSLIAVELQEQVCEIDINPVILGKDNCIAVDALISLHQRNN